MQLHVNPSDELPIYRQIVRQVTDAIAGGRLAAGERLPSHRDLAARLVIAPLTVKKAYDELEREGLIQTERGRGTFVAAGAAEVDREEQMDRLGELVRQLLQRAHLSGVTLGELLNDIAGGRLPSGLLWVLIGLKMPEVLTTIWRR